MFSREECSPAAFTRTSVNLASGGSGSPVPPSQSNSHQSTTVDLMAAAALHLSLGVGRDQAREGPTMAALSLGRHAHLLLV